MFGINQRRVLWMRRFDELAHCVGAVGLNGNSDDRDRCAGVTKFGVEGLPTWQVVSTASIGSPTDDYDFLAAELGERDLIAIEVVEHDVGGVSRVERVPAE